MMLRNERLDSAIPDSFHASSSSIRKSQLILHPGSGLVPESEVSIMQSNPSTPPDTNHTSTLLHSNLSSYFFKTSHPPLTTQARSALVSRVKWQHGCPSPGSKASGLDGAMQ